MTARPWLIASIALNGFLAAGLVVALRPLKEPTVIIPPVIDAGVVDHTNTIVRRENFTWQQVESTNYFLLVKNLRTIDCPEQTIRDIVLSRVNRVFTRRRLNEIDYPNYEWWKSDPDPEIVAAAATAVRTLEAQRRSLLTSLLGTGWDLENNIVVAARGGITLTGPVLGSIPAATKALVLAAIADAQEQIEQYQQDQRDANKPIDPTELVRLREAPFPQLLTLLNPQQLDEFVLRYSPAAQQLREQMRGMNLTQDQFKELFNAVGSVLGQPVYYYNGSDPDVLKQQQDLQAQVDSLIKTVLGQDVYNNYQLGQDPLYRNSKSTAQELGLATASVMPFYEINRATAAELSRISNDSSLSDDEKIQALAQTRVEQQQSLEQLIGTDAFEKYLMLTTGTAK